LATDANLIFGYGFARPFDQQIDYICVPGANGIHLPQFSANQLNALPALTTKCTSINH